MGLSQPKFKQRIGNDPNNKKLNLKQSKGHALLSKLGWKEGEGLGLNSSGNTEAILVKNKQNVLGLGHVVNTQNSWLENVDAFEKLLSSLNQNIPIVEKTTEPASHNIRIVHRQKIAKDRSVSAFGREAVNHILGRKSDREPQTIPKDGMQEEPKTKKRKKSKDKDDSGNEKDGLGNDSNQNDKTFTKRRKDKSDETGDSAKTKKFKKDRDGKKMRQNRHKS